MPCHCVRNLGARAGSLSTNRPSTNPRHAEPRLKSMRPRTRTNQSCRASNLPFLLPTAIQPIVSNKILQGGVSLALLAGIDAAWSGDWSRIGAISKDTELFLQSAMTVFGAWHLFMGMCAYIIADQNSQPALAVTAKALAVGTLPVLELMLQIQMQE